MLLDVSFMSSLGALNEGRRVPAVTIFGWDDVLCPTTYAKQERIKRTAQVFGAPTTESKDYKREVRNLEMLIDFRRVADLRLETIMEIHLGYHCRVAIQDHDTFTLHTPASLNL